MRDSKGKTVKDFFPMLFEDPDNDIDNELTDEDRAFLEDEERTYAQNLMDEFNGQQYPAPPQPAEPAQTAEAPDES